MRRIPWYMCSKIEGHFVEHFDDYLQHLIFWLSAAQQDTVGNKSQYDPKNGKILGVFSGRLNCFNSTPSSDVSVKNNRLSFPCPKDCAFTWKCMRVVWYMYYHAGITIEHSFLKNALDARWTAWLQNFTTRSTTRRRAQGTP